MYKKIPVSIQADEKTLVDAHDYTTAADYSVPVKNGGGGAKPQIPETPAEVGRRIAAAGAGADLRPATVPQKKPGTGNAVNTNPAVRAYLEMQRRHARLSDEIDKRNKTS